MEPKEIKRLIFLVALVLVLLAAFLACRALKHPSFEPYRSLEVTSTAPPGASLRVMFLGVTTILFDDGETAIMTDGFFSRPGLVRTFLCRIEPDDARISYALGRAGVTRLAAGLTGHSHNDHAMDSPEVAKRTNALIIGSESTANIARGLDFPADRLRTITGGETFTFGRFKITTIKSAHSPKGHFMGDITTALHPPARVWAYREGGSYSYLIEHDGRRLLVHPSANYVPGFLNGIHADVVFLGIGTLGKQTDQFAKDYWREVVQATGARVIVPIHWDDFMRPLDQPLLPMPALLDDFDRGIKTVVQLAAADHVTVRFLRLFGSVDVSALSP
jgi:L-ascorbate metabolism protein UlaG (beta-lactamase superfamily)